MAMASFGHSVLLEISGQILLGVVLTLLILRSGLLLLVDGAVHTCFSGAAVEFHLYIIPVVNPLFSVSGDVVAISVVDNGSLL